MTLSSFSAQVRGQPGQAVIDLAGDINAFADEALNHAYNETGQHQPEIIILNFSQVGYINSTGIALIVGLLARARQDNRQMAACGLNHHYQEIFQITRLTDYLKIFPDEASARQELL
jgi:anti-anti-sigma factor